MNGENTLLKRETYNKNRRDQGEHLRVIAHEGEVVVGLKREGCGVEKNASEARGTGGGGRRGARQSRAEGARARESGAWRSGGREAAEPRERPHTQHRRWDCGNCIGGEEVAATLKPYVSYDMGSFFYVWLQIKAVSETNTLLKNVGTKRRPQAVNDSEHRINRAVAEYALLGGGRFSRFIGRTLRGEISF